MARKKEFEEMTEMERVQADWTYLGRAPEQTEDMCLAAVWGESKALELVRDQTVDLCMRAIRLSPGALEHIRKGSQTNGLFRQMMDEGIKIEKKFLKVDTKKLDPEVRLYIEI